LNIHIEERILLYFYHEDSYIYLTENSSVKTEKWR